MNSADATALCAYFGRELVSTGWTESGRKTSSAAFSRDRCRVVLGVHVSGTLFWNVFPTPPPADKLLPGVVTRGNPIPVGAFVIEGVGGALRVTTQASDRDEGRVVLDGDAAAILARLVAESTNRVDTFVRNVERAQ